MRFLSLFSGVGGFDLGLERAGMECVGQVEIDPQCRRVLEAHWPDVWRAEDVRAVSRESFGLGDAERDGSRTAGRGEPQLPIRIDLICGGFPCQDLSVAGKRAGLDGERSGLWFEFHRIVSELRPAYVLVENVPGLLSGCGCDVCDLAGVRIRDHRERVGGPCACIECAVGHALHEAHSGHNFGIVIAGLGELGYSVSWAVLDAQHFGVAQRRRRVFIVAGPDPGRTEAILALAEGCAGHPAASRAQGQDAASEAGAGVANPLGAKRDGGWRGDLDNDTYVPELSYALDGAEGQAVLAYSLGSHAGSNGERSNASHAAGGPVGMGINEEITPAIRAGRSQAIATASVRRLTPVECERLQGFSDGWTDVGGMADGPRYRMLGNAVCVPVIEWIGKRIMAVEGA